MFRLNGTVVDHRTPFDLSDRGLTLGDGLFETIAVFGGRPALLDAHLDRMMTAASEMRLPLRRSMLENEVAALAEDRCGEDCVIRLTVTRGAGARGLAFPKLTEESGEPTVIASSSSYPEGVLCAPVRLATVSTRRNPTSFASRAKTLSYLDNVMAFDEATRAGAGDALMLNVRGRVASTAMANLFALIGNEIVTPPVSEGVLPGVVRRVVLDRAGALGLKAVERPLAQDELDDADAVFATNSVRLVMQVVSIDGRDTRRDGEPVLEAIAARVAAACGLDHPTLTERSG